MSYMFFHVAIGSFVGQNSSVGGESKTSVQVPFWKAKHPGHLQRKSSAAASQNFMFPDAQNNNRQYRLAGF